MVVTGFEPLDILQSVAMLIDQYLSGAVERGESRVENQYSRVVRPEGNLAALKLLDRVFSTRDTFEWPRVDALLRDGDFRGIRRLGRGATVQGARRAGSRSPSL